MEVFAHLLGDKGRTLLFSQSLEVTREVAAQLEERSAGLYFDWGPDSSRYIPHVDEHPPSPGPEEFIGLLGLNWRSTGRVDKSRAG